MGAPLQYDFRVVGQAALKQSIRSVEHAILASHRRMMRGVGAPGGRAVSTSVRTSIPAAARGTGKAQHREKLRQIRDEAREYQRRGIQAQREIREDNRRTFRERRALWREDLKKRRAAERTNERDRSARRRASARALDRARLARATSLRNSLGPGAAAVGSTVRGIGRFAVGATGLIGGFAAGSAVANARKVERDAVALANQAYREGQVGGKTREEIATGVRAQAREIGAESGLGAERVLGGLRQFTAISGNLPVGQKLAPFMADLADATDAEIEDVGRSAGQVVQSLKTAGIEGDEAVKQTIEIMSAMGGQAKLGSIELKDMAQQMGKLTSAATQFDGKASDLVTTMGAMGQLAIAGGAASPEEAMTALMRFADDVSKNSKKFEKQGVQVFTDEAKQKMRDPAEILFDMLEKTGGSIPKMNELFGIRSKKSVDPFRRMFVSAGGKIAGVDAARKMMDEFRKASMSGREVRGSAAKLRATSAKQFDIAVEKFNQAVGTELLPVVTALVPKFTELIPHLASAAKYIGLFVKVLAENPLSTIGQLIALKVSASIMSARIGEAIKTSIMGSASGYGAVPPMGGGPGGVIAPGGGPRGRGRGSATGRRGVVAMGGLGGAPAGVQLVSVVNAAMIGAAIGTAVYAAIKAKGIARFEEKEERDKEIGREIWAASKSGDVQRLVRAKIKAESELEHDLKLKDEMSGTQGGWFGGLSQVGMGPHGAAASTIGTALAGGAETERLDESIALARSQVKGAEREIDAIQRKTFGEDMFGGIEAQWKSLVDNMTADEKVVAAELDAAKAHQDAAVALQDAAKALKSTKPNTGDSPTVPDPKV